YAFTIRLSICRLCSLRSCQQIFFASRYAIITEETILFTR
ncbi:hypothetical protein AZ040_000569, partial [Escherichia coli]